MNTLDRLSAEFDMTGKVFVDPKNGRATTRIDPKLLVTGFELAASIAYLRADIANTQKILDSTIAVLEGETAKETAYRIREEDMDPERTARIIGWMTEGELKNALGALPFGNWLYKDGKRIVMLKDSERLPQNKHMERHQLAADYLDHANDWVDAVKQSRSKARR